MIKLHLIGPWKPQPRSYGEHYTHVHVCDDDGRRYVVEVGALIAHNGTGLLASAADLVPVPDGV